MGVGAGEVCPAANQQQQPLQSIQLGTFFSGAHMHIEASLELLPPPLLDEPPDDDDEPPVSEPGPVPLSLPHAEATSPTVEDAPVTTST
jgi:hypothetical protein